MPQRSRLLVLALAAVLLGGCVFTTAARASLSDPPADACKDPGIQNYESISDNAIETRHLRAETYQNCQSELTRLDALRASVDSMADATTDPTQPAQRVALSGSDRERMDLAWWGVWAAVGVGLALLVLPRLFARFRFGGDF
jgi:hypothetical protein